MESLNQVQQLAVMVLPVLFAITVHETAHGWVAKKLGDSTAFMLGRITLNPIKHIDPIGTVVIPLVTFFLGGFLFGWAKPVPVNWQNLRHPRRDMAIVAIAGPAANLLMVVGWAILLRVGFELQDTPWLAVPLFYMGLYGIQINAVLMVLNLLPILPLDGGRILSSILPPNIEVHFAKLERWGMLVLLVLIFTGLLWAILGPAVSLVQQLSFALVGVS